MSQSTGYSRFPIGFMTRIWGQIWGQDLGSDLGSGMSIDLILTDGQDLGRVEHQCSTLPYVLIPLPFDMLRANGLGKGSNDTFA